MGSPSRVSPSRSATRVVQAPPATPRSAISVNRLGSNRRTRAAQRIDSQMKTLHEIMSRDTSVPMRDDDMGMSKEIGSRDLGSRDRDFSGSSQSGPNSAFKFKSGMPLDLPAGGYRNSYEEDDETITKKRRVNSNTSSGKSKNVKWEDDEGLGHVIQQLLEQNKRMEEKLGRLEKIEQKMERLERVEGRLMRLEGKMDEILRMCR